MVSLPPPASMSTVAHAQEATGTEEQATMKAVVVQGRRVSTADTAIGQGEATNTVAVTRDELLSAPGGISGLKMLESLPGFNVQTDGALGLYEFGNSVTVRAFNLQQIGFVLDGVRLTNTQGGVGPDFIPVPAHPERSRVEGSRVVYDAGEGDWRWLDVDTGAAGRP